MEPNLPENALPTCYNRDCLVLLAQDPSHLFAYWEITVERLALAASYLGREADKLSLGVRLWEKQGTGAREITRMAVAERCGQCYFGNLNPGATYQAEVGVLSGEHFLPLICSEATALPGGQGEVAPSANALRPAFPAAFFARS